MENSEIINSFSTYLKRKGKAKSTLLAYVKDIEQLCSNTNNKSVIELSENDIKQCLEKWHKSGEFSVKTVSRKLNSIRTFYSYLSEKKFVTINPATSIHHPKFRTEKPRVLSKVEYLTLKDNCSDNLKLFTIVELLLQTGMRIGELSRLKVSDVNLNDSTISIAEFSTIEARIVPLNNKTLKNLKLYLSTLERKNKDVALFSTKNGKPIEVRNIRASIDKAIKKSKIKDASVNDIRNTFIVYQLSKGMSIDSLAEIVGHKSTATTVRYIQLLLKQYKDKGIREIIEL